MRITPVKPLYSGSVPGSVTLTQFKVTGVGGVILENEEGHDSVFPSVNAFECVSSERLLFLFFPDSVKG